MGQSLVVSYFHFVFSTKNRHNSINADLELELYPYIISITKELKSDVIAIGGYSNHIHILCQLSKNISVSEYIRKIKSNTSNWINKKDFLRYRFKWQTGYGAFTVRPYDLDVIIKYIHNQKKHHKNISFEDELMSFVKSYKIDYDERYIWE